MRVDYAPGVPAGAADLPVDVRHVRRQRAGRIPSDFDDDAELQRAVDLARGADVAVVVVGEWQNMIGEAASRSSLELPGRQLELLQAVVATGTPVVLLVMNGRPLDLRWAAEHVPAILDIWYPGTQGGAAVANLLFGDVSPGGKLPFSWPRTVGQVPMIYSHTRSHEPENQERRYWDEASTPLFPFGHGLSYGRFDVRRPDRRPASAIAAGETVTVSVDGHQRRRPRRRRGRPALPPPAPRLGVPAGARAQGLPSGSPSRPGESRTVQFALGPAERRVLERGRPRLGDRRLDVRRLGRRRLDRRPLDDLRGDPDLGPSLRRLYRLYTNRGTLGPAAHCALRSIR